LLFDSSGDEVLAQIASDEEPFVRLAELALVHGVARVREALTVRIGPDWTKRYKASRSHAKTVSRTPGD
jgi:hypothetical protein